MAKFSNTNFIALGAIDPMGIHPTQVYPVFSSKSDPDHLCIEIIDSNGIVDSYLSSTFLIGSKDNLLPVRPVVNAIGMPAVFGVAWSHDDVELGKGWEEFLNILRKGLKSKRALLARNPAAGVQFAKLTNSTNYEALFAGLMVRAIGSASLTIADAWVSGADLSDFARERAEKILQQLRKRSILPADPDIRTVRIGSQSFAQGDYMFTAGDGLVVVRIGSKFVKGYEVERVNFSQARSR